MRIFLYSSPLIRHFLKNKENVPPIQHAPIKLAEVGTCV